MEYLHTNNANSNLRTAINSSITTIVVTVGQGVMFPNPGVDQGFFVTVEDRRAGKMEIMLCTARTTDTLTVVRGQQGTVPQSFIAGVNVSNRVTAQILNEFVFATVAVIPLARLPMIPDSKLISISGSKITGTINGAQLPDIPPAKLTSVPAESLTGTINNARLADPLPASKLPEIPASKLTSVPAASLTGTIHVDRLPVIPASKLTSVPASALTGTVPVSSLNASNYNQLNAIAGDGSASFARFIGVTSGTAGAPTNTWSGHGNTGMFLSSDNQVAFSYGGSARMRIGTDISAAGGAKFSGPHEGDGSGLTSLPSAVVRDIVAAFGAGSVGTFALLLGPSGGHSAGSTHNGSDLRTPSLQVDTADLDLTCTYGGGPSGTWRAMMGGSAAADERAFGVFLRIS